MEFYDIIWVDPELLFMVMRTYSSIQFTRLLTWFGEKQ
tara:strand:- start:12145 stop:12258 length:114 start_codon:yes stop_codon:yes gene_type:complete